MKGLLRGSITALVTPFYQGHVHEISLRRLVDFQIKNGASAIVPCGTTGESATLTHEEHNRVISIVIDATQKRVPVIAGTGSNSTREAIELTINAQKLGADAALVITPYYNKPTQEGLFLHYKKIAEMVEIPIILYNVPGRTCVNLLPDTVERLCSAAPNIVGIKEASGNLPQISEILQRCGDRLDVLSGDDALIPTIMSMGGQGVISVAANLVPKRMTELMKYALDKDWTSVNELYFKLAPLFKALFIETNPVPVKAAMAIANLLPSAEVRLPLCELSAYNLSLMKELLWCSLRILAPSQEQHNLASLILSQSD